METWVIVAIVGGAAVLALVAVALGRAAAEGSAVEDEQAQLGLLGRLKSDTGKRFFANEQEVLELADTLEAIQDAERRRPTPKNAT